MRACRRARLEGVYVFIAPPSHEELARRLRGRGQSFSRNTHSLLSSLCLCDRLFSVRGGVWSCVCVDHICLFTCVSSHESWRKSRKKHPAPAPAPSSCRQLAATVDGFRFVYGKSAASRRSRRLAQVDGRRSRRLAQVDGWPLVSCRQICARCGRGR